MKTLKHASSERLAELIAGKIVSTLEGVGSVLDIGCGDGRAQSFLREDVQYGGIDISSACIYEQSRDNRQIVYCDEETLEPTIDGHDRVDAVLLLDVLEHTRDFTGLFVKALLKSDKYVVVSLPNEMFIYDRIRYLFGKELPAHSLDLVGQPEGFKHQFVINTVKARNILVNTASAMGFILDGRWERELKPRQLHMLPAMKLLRLFSKESLWSMGSILIFVKEQSEN